MIEQGNFIIIDRFLMQNLISRTYSMFSCFILSRQENNNIAHNCSRIDFVLKYGKLINKRFKSIIYSIFLSLVTDFPNIYKQLNRLFQLVSIIALNIIRKILLKKPIVSKIIELLANKIYKFSKDQVISNSLMALDNLNMDLLKKDYNRFTNLLGLA